MLNNLSYYNQNNYNIQTPALSPTTGPAISKPNHKYKPPTFQADVISFKNNNFLLRTNEFEDYKQRDIKGKEEFYCGPASAANGIEWLVNNGYPQLKSPNLIEDLATHFKTDKRGTTATNMCEGLESFCKYKGITPTKVEYQGIMEDPDKYRIRTHPSINSIKNGIEKNGFVLLNIGVYNKSGSGNNNTYDKDYGHWVTAIGHFNENGKDYIVIHDPYSKQKNKNFNLELGKIDQGKLIQHDDNEKSVTDDAKGFYEAKSDIEYIGKNQACVITGVVNLEMPPKQ